jgi:hypothetical protein
MLNDGSKSASNKAAGESKSQAYQYFTRPTLNRPRPALAHGYVEDCDGLATQLEATFSGR